MINRLRRKFILVCAVSIFAVVILVFCGIAVLNVSSMNKTLDTLTDSLSEGKGRFPDSFGDRFPVHGSRPQKPDMDFITPETRYATRHFTVWIDENGDATHSNTDFIHSITEEDAQEYAHRAVCAQKNRGWISVYRYKVFADGIGSAVVFVDGTMNRSALMQSLLIAGAVLIAAAVVSLSLIALLSGRVLNPIAESYEKQKQFVTDANHELKTPLTLILTNVDIAEAEVGQNEWLSDIRAEGQRMAELVNQLVSLSRMDEEDSPLQLCLVPLSQLAADTTAEFEVLAADQGKRVVTEIEPDRMVLADETLVRRLMGILMDNAVKYCDAGGRISVTLQKRKHTILTVENTYASVDTVELDRLFDRFYRADKARTYAGGFGVGLSIARSIMEKHRGEITAYKKDNASIGFKVVFRY